MLTVPDGLPSASNSTATLTRGWGLLRAKSRPTLASRCSSCSLSPMVTSAKRARASTSARPVPLMTIVASPSARASQLRRWQASARCAACSLPRRRTRRWRRFSRSPMRLGLLCNSCPSARPYVPRARGVGRRRAAPPTARPVQRSWGCVASTHRQAPAPRGSRARRAWCQTAAFFVGPAEDRFSYAFGAEVTAIAQRLQNPGAPSRRRPTGVRFLLP
jgi:hypothetical protein